MGRYEQKRAAARKKSLTPARRRRRRRILSVVGILTLSLCICTGIYLYDTAGPGRAAAAEPADMSRRRHLTPIPTPGH